MPDRGFKDIREPAQSNRLSFLPIPVFILLALFLSKGPSITYPNPFLLIFFNFTICTLVSLFIFYKVRKIFIIHSNPGLLMFGCGVLIWGCAGFSTAVFGILNSQNILPDADTMVTIYNNCIWVSAILQLAGVITTLNINCKLRYPLVWIYVGIFGVIIMGTAIIWAALSDVIPPFFIPGHGGTLVRQFVLGSAISMFTVTAFLLRLYHRKNPVSALHFYSLGLLLLVVGLSGVWFANIMDSPLMWAGRFAQYAGGIYMLIGALKVPGHAELEEIIATAEPQEIPDNTGVAVSIAVITTFYFAAARLLFFQEMITVPYLIFFPAVIISAIFGGLISGLVATVLSFVLANYLWIINYGFFAKDDTSILLGIIFVSNGIFISFITKILRSAQKRAIEAETKAKFEKELKLSSDQLFKNRAEYKAMIQSFDGFIYITSDENKLEFLNKRLRERLGYDATGKFCHKTLYGLDAPCSWCVRESVNKGENVRWELKNPDDGRWYEVSSSPVFNIDGSISRQAMITDITERKRTEEALQLAHDELEKRVLERTAELEKTVKELYENKQLLLRHTAELQSTVQELHEKEHLLMHQGRLAAMGEMVHNIAHQWRQPLNTLGLLVQSLDFHYEIGEFNQEMLKKNTADSMQLINHMSQTIDDFRNFFQPIKEKDYFNVSEVIESAIKLVDASFSNKNIEIIKDFVGEARVYGYPNEYAQVILNLLANAKDAFLKKQKTDKPVILISSYEKDGHSVVTVKDNAGGIPAKIKNKIFEPYFTTKGSKGTGIGLFMSKNIIEKSMEGTLTVVNIDHGAKFTISIPTTAEKIA